MSSSSSLPTGSHFLAGQIGGMAGVIAGQPFDTVKVLMQTTKREAKLVREISRGSKRQKLSKAGSVLHAVRSLYQRDGFQGFYRGVAYPLLATGVQKSLAFGVSASMRDYLTRRREAREGPQPRAHLVDLLAAGAAAGMVNTLCVAPIDQLKIAQQIHTGDMNFVQTAARLAKRHGYRVMPSLYGAWRITLCREITGYSLYFLIYELLCRGLLWCGVEDNIGATFLAGGMTGTTMWGLYYPLDALKSRQQAQIARKRPNGGKQVESVPTMVEKVMSRGTSRGLGLFYRGITPALMRAFPAHGSIFVGYEGTLAALRWWTAGGGTAGGRGDGP